MTSWIRPVVPLATALLAAAFLPACGLSRSATGVPDRGGGRVILGRLVVDGAPASDWVGGGSYSGAELVVDDHITVHDDHVTLESTSAGAPGLPFTGIGAQGGPIHFGAGDGPVYLLGLRVSRALVVLGTSSVFPILARVPGRRGPCDYVGTIHLRREGDTTRAIVVDDFDGDAQALAATVGRCRPTKNLAQTLDVVNGEVVPVVASAAPSAGAQSSPP
ncbi:MAG TPA: hypothetical protein VK762_29975 [Polyangiaceae bacterium]|jgi:hypothetical protein|nr:hypothetical protein [Polyangiaceae bacterium]